MTQIAAPIVVVEGLKETKLELWDDYERLCRQAREALTDFPARGKSEKRQQLQEDAAGALRGLQEYLTSRYGWGPGPKVQ